VTTIAAFVDGPFWYFSLAVFVIGVTWRLAAILFQGRKPDYSVPKGSAAAGSLRVMFGRFLPRKGMGRQTRLQFIAGYMFHLGLFVLLLFALPHVEFYRDYLLGFDWWTMPTWLFILVSEIAFLGLILLWLHRVLHPVTRQISTTGDHAASILVFLVMLTGCLALARSSEGLRVLHFFLAELLLIYFPFSMLMHTFTFLPSRGYTGAAFGRRGVDA